MKTILLITEGFPYGTSEISFLQTEYECLHEKFRVALLAKKRSESLEYNGFSEDYHELYDDKPSVRYLIKALLKKELYAEIRNIFEGKNSLHVKLKLAKASIGYATGACALLPRLKKVIAEQKVDIVYTYWCGKATLASLWIKEKSPELRVVSRFHGIDLYNERVYGGWQFFRSFMSSGLNELYFVSKNGAEYFNRLWGRQGKIRYIGTARQKEYNYDPSCELVIVSCSAVIELKRVGLIVDALAEIPQSYRVKWHHIGDGDQMPFLCNYAREKLVDKKNVFYKFEGWIENKKIIPLYRKIKPSLFITTSRTEGGSPVSIQEAFSIGIPAIGTNVGGIPDIVKDWQTGFLLNENPSAIEIRDILIQFHNLNKEKKEEFSRNAFSMWEKTFDAEKNAKKMTAELETLQ